MERVVTVTGVVKEVVVKGVAKGTMKGVTERVVKVTGVKNQELYRIA